MVCDTGPLLAAAHEADRAHALAASILNRLERAALVLEPVLVETDQLLRRRTAPGGARRFLTAMSRGEHSVEFLTAGLLQRAVEIDAQYADLDLGLVDASVMAYAERHDLPILTFDFRDFRATTPERGDWRLVVDEDQYRRAVGL